MATAMLTDRGLRRKVTQGDTPKPPKKETKRKSSSKSVRAEQNNNEKRQRISGDAKEDMFVSYQPWVIQTYGDLAKTKTITTKKYARILRTLRGEEVASADNSKFRFWVKAKGFHVGKPPGYDAKPADAIVGRYSVCDADEGIPPTSDQLTGSAKDPSLYVPNTPLKEPGLLPSIVPIAADKNAWFTIDTVTMSVWSTPREPEKSFLGSNVCQLEDPLKQYKAQIAIVLNKRM